MRLSERLEAIIAMIPPCETAADIGTDHGFVPIELVRRKIAERAIASDVRKGPLSRAQAHVEAAGLEKEIDVRLGSGLSTVSPEEADVILIAGMGGRLTVKLLEEGRTVAGKAKTLILSPHTDAAAVRRYVTGNGFRIEDETMVEEDGKFYPILRCEAAGTEGMQAEPLTEADYLFGPVLLSKRPDVFLRFIEKEREKTAALLEGFREKGVRGRKAEEKELYFRRLSEVLQD